MKNLAASFILAALLFFTGCVHSEPWYRSTHAAKRYEGHITLGAPFIEFTPLHSSQSRIPERLPAVVSRYLQRVPSHPDHKSESGYSQSVFVEVVGREIDDEDPYAPATRRSFRILRVERVGPPTKEFLASRTSQ